MLSTWLAKSIAWRTVSQSFTRIGLISCLNQSIQCNTKWSQMSRREGRCSARVAQGEQRTGGTLRASCSIRMPANSSKAPKWSSLAKAPIACWNNGKTVVWVPSRKECQNGDGALSASERIESSLRFVHMALWVAGLDSHRPAGWQSDAPEIWWFVQMSFCLRSHEACFPPFHFKFPDLWPFTKPQHNRKSEPIFLWFKKRRSSQNCLGQVRKQFVEARPDD